jgi:hypothetical protein
MRPDNNFNPNNPERPYTGQPVTRPTQDFGQRPTQRSMQPMQDMRPRPMSPQTPTNFAPRPANQFPANNYQDFRQAQRPPSPQAIQQTAPQQGPLSFAPPKPDKKNRKKFLAVAFVVIALGAASFLFMAGGNSNNEKSKVTAQNNQPTIKPLEKPGFTTYYPSPMPDGLQVAKGSVSYYKDSFTFIIEQGGIKSYFVYEQPANSDPDLNTLKSKLAAPKGIALTIGQGIEGSMDNGTVTAVKTDKNTNIIINCTKPVCSTAPRDILSNMQVNDSLENIKHGNS